MTRNCSTHFHTLYLNRATTEVFPEIIFSHFFQALHLVVIPLSTAFYNIFAMSGIFPELEVQAEKSKLSHHLR
jgi:hypothetical protein